MKSKYHLYDDGRVMFPPKKPKVVAVKQINEEEVKDAVINDVRQYYGDCEGRWGIDGYIEIKIIPEEEVIEAVFVYKYRWGRGYTRDKHTMVYSLIRILEWINGSWWACQELILSHDEEHVKK